MHAIAYILEQFQQSSRGDWSAQVGAFFAWLNRFLIATWDETKERRPPEGVVIPERPADGGWTDPLAEVPGEMRQVEWWQEGEAIAGLLRYAESADDAVLFSFYHFPCAALSLFRLATWYCEQLSP